MAGFSRQNAGRRFHAVRNTCSVHESGELIDAVLHASRALVAVAARSIAQAGDSVAYPPQYRTLVALAAKGPQRVSDLANGFGVHPSVGDADVRPAG